MSANNDRQAGTGESAVIVAAIGDGGCNVLAHMARRSQERPVLVAINSEPLPPAKAQAVRCVQIGGAVMRGMGTGGDPRVGRRAAESDIKTIRSLVENARLFFLVVGLGGGTGTGAAPVVLEAAREAGALTLCFAMLPFEFEGARRMELARQGLMALRDAADGVICMPNQRLFKSLEHRTNIARAFARADEMISQGIYAVWREMSRTEPARGIQIAFNDLRALVRNGSGNCVFACASGAGPNKADEVLKEIKENPLLNEGQVMANAYAFLVSIVGGPDLSLLEVKRIWAEIAACGRQDALIKTGVTCDEAMKDRVFVIVLVSEKDDSVAAGDRGASHEDEDASGGRAAEKSPKPAGGSDSAGKPASGSEKWVQSTLFDSEKTGRFKDIPPTIVQGSNLDIPTFKRRGILIQKPRNGL